VFFDAALSVFFANRFALRVCPGNFFSLLLASLSLLLPIRFNAFDAFFACLFAFFARLVTALESEFDLRNRVARFFPLFTFLLTTLILFAMFFFAAFTRFRPAFEVAESSFPARYRSVLGLRLAILLRHRSGPGLSHVSPAD